MDFKIQIDHRIRRSEYKEAPASYLPLEPGAFPVIFVLRIQLQYLHRQLYQVL